MHDGPPDRRWHPAYCVISVLTSSPARGSALVTCTATLAVSRGCDISLSWSMASESPGAAEAPRAV